jgi:hypothetical protein
VTKGATPIQEVDGPFPSSSLDETGLSNANSASGDASASVLYEGKGSEVDVYV